MPFGALARRTATVRLARSVMVAVGASCALALGGCASGGAPTPAVTSTPSAPATTVTSPTPVADPSVLDALDRAERRLAAAAGDCAAACDAMREIVDARVRLCSPRTDACEDAERRENEARRTVTTTCGACGGDG